MRTYRVHIGGVERDLPVVKISDELSICVFDIFGDTDVVEPCARALAEKLPPVDLLLTAEAKSIPLIYELAKVMGMPRYLIARKKVKLYMEDPMVTRVNAITNAGEQLLVLDKTDYEFIRGKRIALVDDVISTGSSIHALEDLVTRAGGIVACKACVLTEGDSNGNPDIICLDTIPLIHNN